MGVFQQKFRSGSMRRILLTLAGLFLASFSLAGCDKCGDPIKFNAPSEPKTCYDTPHDK
jgi:hypothetical protein